MCEGTLCGGVRECLLFLCLLFVKLPINRGSGSKQASKLHQQLSTINQAVCAAQSIKLHVQHTYSLTHSLTHSSMHITSAGSNATSTAMGT